MHKIDEAVEIVSDHLSEKFVTDIRSGNYELSPIPQGNQTRTFSDEDVVQFVDGCGVDLDKKWKVVNAENMNGYWNYLITAVNHTSEDRFTRQDDLRELTDAFLK